MESFEKLYRQFQPGVFRYLYFLSGDTQTAEELTQETFYQVLISKGRFQGRSAVSTWIIAIARRVYLKHQRKETRYSGKDIDWSRLPAAGRETPEVIWDNEEGKRQVVDIFRLLPEDYRSVIVWREIDGRSFEEIGTVMGKSSSAVRVILFRAKKRFRQLYYQKYGNTTA